MTSKTIPSTSLPASESAAAGLELLGKIASAPLAIVRWAGKEAGTLNTIHELELMDDHMLRDIGLTRDEIRTAVRRGRKPVR